MVMAMQTKLKFVADKIDQLSLRERVLVLLAILVVLHQAWDSLVWLPLVEKQDSLQQQSAEANEAMSRYQLELQLLSATAAKDPDRQTKQAIQSLSAQLKALKQQIEDVSASLITPSDMSRLLEELLTQEKGLRLVALKTLGSTPLIGAEEEKQVQASYQIFRHEFEVVFEGGYLATLRYLEALEELPWKFFWDGVVYSVKDYPDSEVRLRLYTLSLSEGWIGV